MPHPDEFLTLCLVLSHYDIETPIAVILERHREAFPTDLACGFGDPNFGPRDHADFARLVKDLQAPCGASLKHVVVQILEFDHAAASDTDIGWYVFPHKSVRIEKVALRALLVSSDAHSPTTIRQTLAAIYKMTFPP